MVLARVEERVSANGKIDPALVNRYQHQAHGLAWLATYEAALRALLGWAERLTAERPLREIEHLILVSGFAEYIAQIGGGIPMSQVETIRPADFGLEDAAAACLADPACRALIAAGGNEARLGIARLLGEGAVADRALGDELLEMMADQFSRFVEDKVAPHAHQWHLDNAYIPMDVVRAMAGMGVFGLTVPEEFGGSGLGKLAMCLVSEELSRGYIGVGSLGTRSEIAAELIRLGGTEAQKEHYLPRLASGEILPTAVFTEPNVGSDLASLRTRAVRATNKAGEPVWRVTGNKTWITHGARSDLMTLLVRTDPSQTGYRGLSMLLAEKPRGDDANPFPAPGMSGSEIAVLGYRGMKEYEIAFEDFEVPENALLGGVEGQGFKQLMETFESARIQTAARAVGVAQNALELGLAYAADRIQFGEPIAAFPRIAGKLGWMAAEMMIARQLSYVAAREKDEGKRCDIDAGMAKLLAARVAWTNADNALQIHGGNGFALEYPISRVLCDARILNIFEGAAEIQAQVIARGLLGRGNR
uniref:acyl-CoA dehydrogenase family protein n=1 Tax=Sphingomonas bacterium TaxID=1895847 RepID=UPI002615003F|nr:acyl-CoA dehydrogenase family protein [Sphingomonas bacterium]